jgi:hypothetical protein
VHYVLFFEKKKIITSSVVNEHDKVMAGRACSNGGVQLVDHTYFTMKTVDFRSKEVLVAENPLQKKN